MQARSWAPPLLSITAFNFRAILRACCLLMGGMSGLPAHQTSENIPLPRRPFAQLFSRFLGEPLEKTDHHILEIVDGFRHGFTRGIDVRINQARYVRIVVGQD